MTENIDNQAPESVNETPVETAASSESSTREGGRGERRGGRDRNERGRGRGRGRDNDQDNQFLERVVTINLSLIHI